MTKYNKHNVLVSHAMRHVYKFHTLTNVSRQWGVRPRQGGRCAGQDEAFTITGSATRTHRNTKSKSIFVFILFEAPLTPDGL